MSTSGSEWIAEMVALLGADRVRTDQAALRAVSADESSLDAVCPDAVAWPADTAEVAGILQVACRHGVPVTARGAGSSLEGNPIPVQRGLVLDLSRMNRILDVRVEDRQADVEPGVVYAELNRVLRPHGLFFPPSPGGSSDVATIGGMVANNASGIYSARYGGTGEHVRALLAVTGTGQVLRLGNRCRKHSSGYDLVHLIVGSEGTLAVVTEVTLALAPLPEHHQRLAFVFTSEVAATDAVADCFRFGVDVAAAEFLDERTMSAIGRFTRLALPAQPLLLIEVHGLRAVVREAVEMVRAVAEDHGGAAVSLPEGVDAWRDVRGRATRAVAATLPGAAVVRADIAVPVSALPEVVEAARREAGRAGVGAYVFGHAGSGILHVLMPVEAGERDRAEEARGRLLEAVLELGGAVSGEHGMGLGNRRFARRAFGPALEVMQAVKRVFDPAGILNPGKIWEPEDIRS